MARGGPQTPLNKMFVFDLESCDDLDTLHLEVPHQRVWLCGYMNLQSEVMQSFTSLEQCLTDLFKEASNQHIEVGIHNLSFDGSFLIPQLVAMGYSPVESKPTANEFSVLISDRNQWYSIQVQVSAKRMVTFWDTLKLFPSPLKHLHYIYNTPTKKLREDSSFYELIRKRDHEPTDDELMYFHNDLKVLQEVLCEHIKYEGLTFKKTQASQAFYNFTQRFKAWKLRFPSLSEQLDLAIRPAYLGGISYVNPLHQAKEIEHVRSMDINSSYPYELSSKPLPYGYMNRELSGVHPQMNQFWIAEAVVRFELKKNKLPCIAKRQLSIKPIEFDLDSDLKWLHSSDGLVQMTFSSIDYLTYQESYEFEVIEWGTSYHWAQKVHSEIRNFVLKNNKDKVEFRGQAKQLVKQGGDAEKINELLALAQRAKINNNAFYGKFGEEIVKIGKNVVIQENGSIEYVESREEVLTPFKRKYLPVAIAVTAYARRHLVKVANLLGEDFIYCDTDSVYFREHGYTSIQIARLEGDLVIDVLELGAWSMDGKYQRMKALRPKTYITEDEEGKIEVTCAGLPADEDALPGEKKRSCLSFENFEVGTIIKGGNGKLRPYLTPTGKKLLPTDFEIGANKLFNF